jgi:hypothetical protein
VLCAGQTVHVTGQVDGDVRLAGQTVTLGAKVSGNATVAGQTFTLESTGSIGRDLSAGATDSTLNGPVGRDLAVGGNNVTLGAKVGGDVRGTVNKLSMAPGTDIQGAVTYESAQNATRDPAARVAGRITRTTPREKPAPKRGAIFGFGIGWFIYWFLAMLLTAMAVVLLFPGLLQSASSRVLARPWKALLVGFVACLAMPVLLIVLAITVIGLPLALVLGAIWLVIWLLSGPSFGYVLGRLLLRGSQHSVLIMLAGASLLLVLYFIPVIGVIALLAATWFGVGMILLELTQRIPRPEYRVTDTTAKRK